MNRNLMILIAEDDENDILLLERALRKIGLNNPIGICRDGEDTIAYLRGSPPYDDRNKHPFPSVLFLDIKMPKKSGLEVLRWLQRHPHCNVIPTLVLTSSREESDIREAYAAGANSYMVKPQDLQRFQAMVKSAVEYWSCCEKPKLPHNC